MSGSGQNTNTLNELRKRAEALCRDEDLESSDVSRAEVHRLLHELHTHQLELELQNEELRNVQSSLMDAHERMSNLFDFAPVGYLSVDDNGVIIEANLTAAAMLGVDREKLLQKLITEFIQKADQDAYYLHRRAVAQATEPMSCELRLSKMGDLPFWASMESLPLRGHDNQPKGLRIVIADISEAHYAREMADAAMQDWVATFDAIEDSIVISGEDGLIRRCNSATERLLNRPLKEIVGHCCRRLLYETNDPNTTIVFDRAIGSLARESFEFRRHARWLNATVDVILDDDGEFAGAVHTILDITERRKAAEVMREFERQLLQTQKLESLGVLAGGVAHDFNNILHAILGNVDLARGAMTPDATGKPYLDQIEIGALRAAELTDQMLAYSGSAPLTIEQINLSSLVREMSQLLKVTHGKKVHLESDLDNNLPLIEGDPAHLRQIVLNLITNASDAIGDEVGTVSIRTGVETFSSEYLAASYVNDELPGGRFAFLEVADTGIGMEEDTKRRIFEPFFTTKFTGRGLGMAATLGIIRAHRGAISIDTKVGRGTTMRVLFPVSELLPSRELKASPVEANVEVEEEQQHAEEAVTWGGHGTILLVDDEAQIRTMFKTLLERKGFAVLTAGNGREAIAIFEKHRGEIACVLLDFTMPEMDGMETCLALRRIQESTPIILVSGYREDELRGQFGDIKPDGFLKKPLRNSVLLETLREVLGR